MHHPRSNHPAPSSSSFKLRKFSRPQQFPSHAHKSPTVPAPLHKHAAPSAPTFDRVIALGDKDDGLVAAIADQITGNCNDPGELLNQTARSCSSAESAIPVVTKHDAALVEESKSESNELLKQQIPSSSGFESANAAAASENHDDSVAEGERCTIKEVAGVDEVVDGSADNMLWEIINADLQEKSSSPSASEDTKTIVYTEAQVSDFSDNAAFPGSEEDDDLEIKQNELRTMPAEHLNSEHEGFFFSKGESGLEDETLASGDCTLIRPCQELPHLSKLGAALTASDLNAAVAVLEAARNEAVNSSTAKASSSSRHSAHRSPLHLLPAMLLFTISVFIIWFVCPETKSLRPT